MTNKYNECCICLDSINDNQNMIITKCKHYYHKKCLHLWLEKSNSCCICRNKLKNINIGNSGSIGVIINKILHTKNIFMIINIAILMLLYVTFDIIINLINI